jgi:hypothetical protein
MSVAVAVNNYLFSTFYFKILDVLDFFNTYVSRLFLVCRFTDFAINLYIKRCLDINVRKRLKYLIF